ncbi:GFA family protein [Sinisalibacter lacisalsi]|uniref:GFA family protein n=1 Tax=Sinisalibacter lacisalsi TaxID=1526570 RepID=UPI001668D92B|nr:GFA family protein [Sinisalibacter lacisalsi]
MERDFADGHSGGCQCGRVRYRTVKHTANAFVCNCRFCQKFTGGPYLLEHCFFRGDIEVVKGNPKTYTHISQGSGKKVFLHFCEDCGTHLFMTFERYPDSQNIITTSLDRPQSVDYGSETLLFLYLQSAQSGTVTPAGYRAYRGHCDPADGSVAQEVVSEAHILHDDLDPTEGPHTGGCLCGSVRFEADGKPDFVVVCHCRSCQMSLGTEVNHELLFKRDKFRLVEGESTTFVHLGGSGKRLKRHFCGECGSALWVTGERFPEIGLYRGALDRPNRIQVTRDNAFQIFLSEALPISMVVAGIEAFPDHRRNADDSINSGVVYQAHWRLADGPPEKKSR